MATFEIPKQLVLEELQTTIRNPAEGVLTIYLTSSKRVPLSGMLRHRDEMGTTFLTGVLRQEAVGSSFMRMSHRQKEEADTIKTVAAIEFVRNAVSATIERTKEHKEAPDTDETKREMNAGDFEMIMWTLAKKFRGDGR